MARTARVREQVAALVRAGEVRTPLDALAMLVQACDAGPLAFKSGYA